MRQHIDTSNAGDSGCAGAEPDYGKQGAQMLGMSDDSYVRNSYRVVPRDNDAINDPRTAFGCRKISMRELRAKTPCESSVRAQPINTA